MARSREIKDFVSSFAAGWKMSEDAEYKKALIDYYKRKGGAGGSGFTDEDRAKIDERFGGSGGIFGKLFGGDKPKFASPEEEGEARARADALLHLRNGNAEGYAKAAKNVVDFNKLLRAGEKSNAPKPPAQKPSATPQKTALNEEPQINGGGSDDNTEPPAGQPPVVTAALPVDPENPEFDPGATPEVFASNGGWVPTRYAVGGGSMDYDDGEDDAEDDSSDDAGGGDAEPQTTGSVAPQSTGSKAPQSSYFTKMTKDAHTAVVLGATSIKRDLKGAAIVEGDPNTVAKHVNWLTNKGRFSDEELAEMDKKIDPEGTMPREYRSIARLSAVAKFAKDNPEQGEILAKRLLLTDKFQSQARGAYALQAIKAGKWGDAIKAIEDGYQHNDYDGRVVKASLNDDGSVTAQVSEDGRVVEQFKATKPQVIQLATSMASGDEFVRRMAAVAQAYQDTYAAKGKGRGRGGSGGGSSSGGGFTSAMDDLADAEGKRKAAAAALEEAKTDEDKKAAQETLDELTKTRDEARSRAMKEGMSARGKTNEVTHRNNVLKAIEDELKRAKATSVPLKPPSQALPTGPGTPMPPRRPEELGGKPPPGQEPMPQPQALGPVDTVVETGKALGNAVAGKNWTPKDTVQRDSLQAQLTETQNRIEQLESRTHPSMRGQPNPVVDQLKSQAADLKNRIDTYDPKTGAYLKAIEYLGRVPLDDIVNRMKERKVPQDVIDSVIKYANRDKKPSALTVPQPD